MSRRDSGQAMVETAIVMPLTVFMVLGLFQIGLMQQGHTLAKYAAFKAARAGAIHSAKMSIMENAAIAVLVPVIGRKSQTYAKANSALELTKSFNLLTAVGTLNMHLDAPTLKIAEITICNPTTKEVSGSEVDFDDPAIMNSAAGWDIMDKGKLAVQVTFNYRLVIPFANMVIWKITRASTVGDGLIRTVRLGSGTKQGAKYFYSKGRTEDVDLYGTTGKYFLPIRANWAMRMQSNFFPDKDGFKLPSENKCVIPFDKKS